MAILSESKLRTKDGREILIRSAIKEDASATLSQKHSSILEEVHQMITPKEFKTTIESEEKWIEQHRENPYYIALVAVLDNEIVGLIDFSNEPKDRIAHAGYLGMSINKANRSSGIGTILLKALIDWAKTTDKIEKINLRVHSDNDIAIGLYKKMGFEIEGVQKRDLKYGPGKYVDTVLMGKILDKGIVASPPKGLFKRIEAVMIHVPDPKEGLRWYQKAFPEAKLVHLPDFNFDLLDLNGIKIEVVQADEKVGAGTFGLAVDWEVESFDQAFKHLTALGATLYRGPMKIEAGFRMCKLKDPFGNLLGLRGP